MITNVSALLDRRTRASVLSDDLRGQAIYRIRKSGVCAQDTPEILNCSRPVLWTLLAPQLPRARRPAGISPASGELLDLEDEALDFEEMTRNQQCLALYRPPTTERARAKERQKLARHLAAEIRRWLSAFETCDLDRRVAIEEAGLHLDHSPLNSAGEYVFDVDRAVLDALAVWKPKTSCTDHELGTALGRWLACWILFWVTDPFIWNRALDTEYQFFGEWAEAEKAA